MVFGEIDERKGFIAVIFRKSTEIWMFCLFYHLRSVISEGPNFSQIGIVTGFTVNSPSARSQDFKFKTMYVRGLSRAVKSSQRTSYSSFSRYFSMTAPSAGPQLENPPKGYPPESPGRGPPNPPAQESKSLESNSEASSFLGTKKRMPEFNLADKVVLVSGAARGLGLTQAEALLEAGATVYALDRLPEPSPDFYRIQQRAAEELGTTLYYKKIDVRNVEALNKVVETIGEEHGRMDGLVAAAGIQQETTALEYTAKDANLMFEINITGVFMTAQAVAKQMIRFGNGGSIALIASMSATIANRVSSHLERAMNLC